MISQGDQRRQSQLDFLASGRDIEVGDQKNLPIELEVLKGIDQHSTYVEAYFNAGLTAEVYKLNIEGKHWTLKKKRPNSLVKNVDGQTSFLNEVQRRRDFERLKANNRDGYTGIVDTAYASLKHELILSPWIEGQPVKRFTQEIIRQLYDTLFQVEIAGLFEWDLSPGNLLVQEDGRIILFDFGYMYPFNPLSEYNSEGKNLPLFHEVERFETRCYMQVLMDLEEAFGRHEALEAFRVEKKEAVGYYRRKMEWLMMNQAEDDLINWVEGLVNLWEEGLSNPKKLSQLYDLESFRSYILDVHDDIGGKSCTSSTLSKINKVIEQLQTNYEFLKDSNGLFWGDETLDQFQLLEKYREVKGLAETYQL